MNMDFSDPRFHRKTIRWASLIADGYDPALVRLEAQKKGFPRIARSAHIRIENESRQSRAGKDGTK